MKTKWVFYHNDPDGWCSAAKVLDAFNWDLNSLTLYPINYGQKFPFDRVKTGDMVYMVDFALQPMTDMIRLKSIVGATNFVWIDHHTTALNDTDVGSLADCHGVRRVGSAACQLTHEFFCNDELPPPVINLIGFYDVWNKDNGFFDWEREVVPFMEWVNHQRLNPKYSKNLYIWKSLLYSDWKDLQPIISEGSFIKKINEKRNRGIVKVRYHEGRLTSNTTALEVIAVNMPGINSRPMEEFFNPVEHDAIMVYSRLPSGMMTVSLYVPESGSVDSSITSKEFGGGGHKAASGFQISMEEFNTVFTIKK